MEKWHFPTKIGDKLGVYILQKEQTFVLGIFELPLGRMSGFYVVENYKIWQFYEKKIW